MNASAEILVLKAGSPALWDIDYPMAQQKLKNVQLMVETVPHKKFSCQVAPFWVMSYMWQNVI